MMPDSILSSRQQQLLEYLRRTIRETGIPPTLRQAGEALGISHTAVSNGLRVLEEKGYIRRRGQSSRAISLVEPVGELSGTGRKVPVIGRIAAGLPLYAQQEWDGYLVVDPRIYRGDNLFALRIQGDSMRDAGILDGDLAICEPRQFAENGEIVVALVDNEEATVKRFWYHGDHIELRPENPAYQPLRCQLGEVLIQGKVIGIHRGPEGFETR
ncbi:transcriptional repressor LexA [Desulfolithobacter dissulfuricans]|nr:transcriptional repressor LexA [Desulfolithobacter dissulfuricans]